MQPAQFAHPFHILQVLNEGLHGFKIDAVIFLGKLFKFQAAGFVGQVVRVIHTGAFQHADHVCEGFLVQIATQLDVDATTGHVGGNGNHSKSACPGNDLGFFIVLAGV